MNQQKSVIGVFVVRLRFCITHFHFLPKFLGMIQPKTNASHVIRKRWRRESTGFDANKLGLSNAIDNLQFRRNCQVH